MAGKKNSMNHNDEHTTCSDANLSHGKQFYEIRVKGQLNSCWSDWLEGMQVGLVENGDSILSGSIVDQAALMGLLNKLSRLNLTLLSLNVVSEETK